MKHGGGGLKNIKKECQVDNCGEKLKNIDTKVRKRSYSKHGYNDIRKKNKIIYDNNHNNLKKNTTHKFLSPFFHIFKYPFAWKNGKKLKYKIPFIKQYIEKQITWFTEIRKCLVIKSYHII